MLPLLRLLLCAELGEGVGRLLLRAKATEALAWLLGLLLLLLRSKGHLLLRSTKLLERHRAAKARAWSAIWLLLLLRALLGGIAKPAKGGGSEGLLLRARGRLLLALLLLLVEAAEHDGDDVVRCSLPRSEWILVRNRGLARWERCARAVNVGGLNGCLTCRGSYLNKWSASPHVTSGCVRGAVYSP